VRVLAVILYSAMRTLGGRDDETLKKYHIPFDNRLWKRFIAPVYLAGVCIANAVVAQRFHWFYLLSAPAFVAGAYCDGYGNDSGVRWREVLQRVLSALASTAPAIILAIGSHSYTLLLIQLLIAVTVKVTLNFVNLKAPLEEFLINFLDSFLKPYLV